MFDIEATTVKSAANKRKVSPKKHEKLLVSLQGQNVL